MGPHRYGMFYGLTFCVSILICCTSAFVQQPGRQALSQSQLIQPCSITTASSSSCLYAGRRSSGSSSSNDREMEFPEQYPATYELNTYQTWRDFPFSEASIVRPLLKQTQLEKRPLQVVYDAGRQGWNVKAFHRAVDGKGAAVIMCKASGGRTKGWFGGYNPKGWSSNGGARPSVAAFLWYTDPKSGKLQKLRKLGGGGLACARDEPSTGIWLGADGLIIPLAAQPSSFFPTKESRMAQSRLGTYYEQGPDRKLSLFGDRDGGVVELSELKVLVGVYGPGEEIPYSGAVLDFTSG